MQEFKDRTTEAERELKDREERELKKLAPAEEKTILKAQIGKQRNEIIQKTKAVTAGWDAAANADEKLEKEVSKAYNKGLAEGKKKNETAWADLNAAVEKKELRLTEILVEMSNMEAKVREADNQVALMKEQVAAAQLEVADAVASFAAGGGDGGGDGASSAEMETLRDSLEAAHDEIVTYSERCESFEREMKIMSDKMAIYEQLLAHKPAPALQPSPSAPTVGMTPNASSAGLARGLDAAIEIINQAITKVPPIVHIIASIIIVVAVFFHD